MTETDKAASRAPRILARVAVLGMVAAVVGLGALTVWATRVSNENASRLAGAAGQTAGHLRAVQALGQIDTATDALEDGIAPVPLAKLRSAQAVLDESLRRMSTGGLAGETRLASATLPAVPSMRRRVNDFLEAVRADDDELKLVTEEAMEEEVEVMQLRFDDLAVDPSFEFAHEARNTEAAGNAIERNALVMVPLGLLFVALGGWQLRSYRRRTEAVLQDAVEINEREARTDELTGLGNRRALVEELERRFAAGEGMVLALADLNGFKHYNDTFGHAAGDSLLRRLGVNLEDRCEGRAVAVRLGGDEFCVVASADQAPESIAALTRAALVERGTGFEVGCEVGVVRVPEDARDVNAALRLADARMYEGKASSRRSVEREAVQMLLRMLDERHPGLSDHVEDVAELAAACAHELGLAPAEILDVRVAAQLHDVGKVAIPSAIISKPGPLTADEWVYMRRHTLIGERVLHVVPTMRNVAKLVRASHERWDGRGYPDRTAGEDTPVGARIVAVADAFCAMTEARPYCAARNVQEALDELARCAGTQFDPIVVDAFLRVWAQSDGLRSSQAAAAA